MYNQPLADASLVACPSCDLVVRLPDLEPGDAARCPRCATELWRRRVDSQSRTLALAVAAAILYLIANSAPMLGLEVVGRSAATTVFGGAQQLWRDGRESVAALVLFTAVVAPALQIGFMVAILLGARRARPRAWVGTLMRHHPTTRTWSMVEVMLLGVLGALVKIAELATVIPGVALFALGALVVVLTAMQLSFDPREIWARVEWHADAAERVAGFAPVAGETR